MALTFTHKFTVNPGVSKFNPLKANFYTLGALIREAIAPLIVETQNNSVKIDDPFASVYSTHLKNKYFKLNNLLYGL